MPKCNNHDIDHDEHENHIENIESSHRAPGVPRDHQGSHHHHEDQEEAAIRNIVSVFQEQFQEQCFSNLMRKVMYHW